MNHVHISTGFMLVVVVLILGLLGIVLAFLIAKRNSANEARRLEAEAEYQRQMADFRKTVKAAEPGAVIPVPERPAGFARGSYTPPSPYYPPQQPPAPTVVHAGGGGGNDMLTGVLIGNMLSDHGHHSHSTVVHETSAPAVSHASSSSSSSDSGGFDFSWGSSSGSSFDFSFGD